MYERMLDKQVMPTVSEMAEYCGENAGLFSAMNDWITATCSTGQKVVFPYGNHYGWGIGHYRKNKLLCNLFPESGAFTVMMRLTNAQCEEVYPGLSEYSRAFIDNKYPCSGGGWIHYRVLCQENFDDLQKLIGIRCP